MHASRLEQMHREELEHERVPEEFNMPGLGFEGDLLEKLQQQGILIENEYRTYFVINRDLF